MQEQYTGFESTPLSMRLRRVIASISHNLHEPSCNISLQTAVLITPQMTNETTTCVEIPSTLMGRDAQLSSNTVILTKKIHHLNVL